MATNSPFECHVNAWWFCYLFVFSKASADAKSKHEFINAAAFDTGDKFSTTT
jgi:hypothetical protein